MVSLVINDVYAKFLEKEKWKIEAGLKETSEGHLVQAPDQARAIPV